MTADRHDSGSLALPARARLDGIRSQRAFRVLLEALARPATVVVLPPGVLDPSVPAPLLMPLALADVGVRVDVVGPDAARWLDVVVAATGARRCPTEAADLVAVLGRETGTTVRALRRGRPEAPEEGARLALPCRRLRPAATGRGAQVVVEVSGPGVDGVREVGIDGLAPGVLEALAEVNDAFPTGVDTWLLSDAGQVAGLPRSARLRIHPGSGHPGRQRRH